ncbi:Protein CHUP1, chloroplastic, partial [Mucuna pruriens]
MVVTKAKRSKASTFTRSFAAYFSGSSIFSVALSICSYLLAFLSGLIRSRAAPPPRPPPTPPSSPPPPPRKRSGNAVSKLRKTPEVLEFYSLMMNESQSQEKSNSGTVTDPRNVTGEVDDFSSLAVTLKTDVEAQEDFIRSLIEEVKGAAFTDIEDVVLFVKWLDDELSNLVDEGAVLKHLDWPEQKANTLREAASWYCDLKKLKSKAWSFHDDPQQPRGPALEKMQTLLEKLENGVYNISRMRESATNRYQLFHIPVNWMLDNGFVSQMKLASVKIAMKYMKRISAELERVGDGSEEEELIVQGVRFAFRVHQFAGGFDVETMIAFEELREKRRLWHIQSHSQQGEFFSRTAT